MASSSVNPIPEKVVNYNVYNGANKLVGVSAEITMPNLETNDRDNIRRRSCW